MQCYFGKRKLPHSQLKTSATQVFLLGEGERYKRECEEILAQQGVGNVRFLGFYENPYSIMNMSDIVVLASYFEGCPLVLLEEALLGKAIISSDIPASKEVLSDEELGECAAFFPSKDARALAERMRELYEDESRRAELGAKAKRRAEAFGVEKAVRAFERVLRG